MGGLVRTPTCGASKANGNTNHVLNFGHVMRNRLLAVVLRNGCTCRNVSLRYRGGRLVSSRAKGSNLTGALTSLAGRRACTG